MQETMVRSLRSRLPDIRARWEALLHAEPVKTPLAYPDSLVHLLDWTLEEIFHGLAALPVRRRLTRKPPGPRDQPICPCGRNPLLTYFAAGEQAMREALVLVQAASPLLDPLERDAALNELDLVFQHIARREIESFCGVCQYRGAGSTTPDSACLHERDLLPFQSDLLTPRRGAAASAAEANQHRAR
ncbi:MAG TPA: hypothetical protein VL069_01755 [Opitutus sp.]|nr:hypothetical protein [Opitutus sp.]